MSASLIGRLRSSAFRLSTTAASTSLAGSRYLACPHHDDGLLLLQINECAPIRVHQGSATGEVSMTNSDDWRKTVRLNKLLGMWAAEKLGITGRDAEAYSDALAVGTLDPERSDVLSKIRKDFDAAGVVQSDEQMLRVLNELTLQAGGQSASRHCRPSPSAADFAAAAARSRSSP